MPAPSVCLHNHSSKPISFTGGQALRFFDGTIEQYMRRPRAPGRAGDDVINFEAMLYPEFHRRFQVVTYEHVTQANKDADTCWRCERLPHEEDFPVRCHVPSQYGRCSFPMWQVVVIWHVCLPHMAGRRDGRAASEIQMGRASQCSSPGVVGLVRCRLCMPSCARASTKHGVSVGPKAPTGVAFCFPHIHLRDLSCLAHQPAHHRITAHLLNRCSIGHRCIGFSLPSMATSTSIRSCC
jgi:hypothetical protein